MFGNVKVVKEVLEMESHDVLFSEWGRGSSAMKFASLLVPMVVGVRVYMDWSVLVFSPVWLFFVVLVLQVNN